MKFKKSDYMYFDMARKEALKSDFDGIHVGAVIVYKGRIIGSGHNSRKTRPQQKKYNKYRDFRYDTTGKRIEHCVHAEIAAICNIPYPIMQNIKIENASIYIFRICKGKSLGQGLSRPCSSCLMALKDTGISNIYYSTDDGFAYEKVF